MPPRPFVASVIGMRVKLILDYC
uniref:Uncharacterized protein n=1 Tax=Arundo donax TaxID=35708 RepID=A0A0A9C5L9_ARUDO